ncbi:Dps family protein [Marinoscillum sp. MHG1-6]|uniref:Dps family protein n=1 Tax=Marinoscillum sp. MHG1-6 TaxID=2959627 RepID=UPI0021578A1A|nr:DNA starvation/stationary phase protection protein [Marinoscillum sp. MHG1-6]
MSYLNLHLELNQLLSDFHIYYQNTRGFHWNIKGKRFFELHTKFEELYTEAFTTIDELAEHLLSIGGEPLHCFSDYLKTSTLMEYQNLSEDTEIVKALLLQLQSLIKQENKVKDMAAELGDKETEDMMIALVNSHQKNIWMFNAWLTH